MYKRQVASATQVQQAPVHSSPSSVTTQAANGTTAQHPQASEAVQPGAPASPGAASSAPSQGAGVAQTAKEERKIPVMKMSSLGVSIKLSLIHISEPTRLGMISYAVFCLKKKKK